MHLKLFAAGNFMSICHLKKSTRLWQRAELEFIWGRFSGSGIAKIVNLSQSQFHIYLCIIFGGKKLDCWWCGIIFWHFSCRCDHRPVPISTDCWTDTEHSQGWQQLRSDSKWTLLFMWLRVFQKYVHIDPFQKMSNNRAVQMSMLATG